MENVGSDLPRGSQVCASYPALLDRQPRLGLARPTPTPIACRLARAPWASNLAVSRWPDFSLPHFGGERAGRRNDDELQSLGIGRGGATAGGTALRRPGCG